MPIIEPLSDTQSPLAQGDVLHGISLFSTKCSSAGDGQVLKTPAVYCLVLSRPCVAVRDEWVIVAVIEKYKNRPPGGLSTFDQVEAYFIEIRDGLKTPDLFYLGQIAGHEGSFCARFDFLHTLQLPKEGTLERQEFLRAKRIGRLHIDFARDLHVRLFRAFASLGFDDHRWFPLADLQAVVAMGKTDLAQKTAELAALQAKLELGHSQGFAHESEKKKLEREAAKLQESLADLTAQLRPYQDELQRRARPNPLTP